MAKRTRPKRYSLADDLEIGTTGELRVGPVRAVLITESAFVFLQRVIHEQMPELLKYGFYEMGYRAGLDLSKQVKAITHEPEEAFRYAVETYRQAGYGDVRIVHYDLKEPQVRLEGHNLLESSAARRSEIFRTPRAVDHYGRGFFAGLISQLVGKEVICEEMRCEFRGDDACEFVILPLGGGA